MPIAPFIKYQQTLDMGIIIVFLLSIMNFIAYVVCVLNSEIPTIFTKEEMSNYNKIVSIFKLINELEEAYSNYLKDDILRVLICQSMSLLLVHCNTWHKNIIKMNQC